jgi:hypothetical protein
MEGMIITMAKRVFKLFILSFFLIILLTIVLKLIDYTFLSKSPSEDFVATASTIEITGTTANKEDTEECLELLKANLKAVNEKDVDAYVETLVSSAREETAAEMKTFFENYDIKNTLLKFNVVRTDNNTILVETKQKSINLGTNEYKNHITYAQHTFITENGKWKIAQTAMTDTEFID